MGVDLSVFKKERDANNAYYKTFIERDIAWFENVKRDWIEQHPNATLEEAFASGYLLSEEHPLSRTIHNILNFHEDFYKWKKFHTRAAMQSIFNVFRNKEIKHKTKIEIPEYYDK